MSDSKYNPRRWAAGERSRPRRQSTRWALLLGYVFLFLWPVTTMLQPDDRASSVMPPVLMLVIGASMSPFARRSLLTARGFAGFDEFERMALLSALRRSHLFSLVLIATVFIWLLLAQAHGWPFPHLLRQWMVVGGTLLVAIAGLPVLIAEWTVPLPEPDDQPL